MKLKTKNGFLAPHFFNYASIDKEALEKNGSKKDRDVINALTGNRGETNRFRVKRIKYGNHNAIQEVLSEKLYFLTGLESPRTILMVGKELFSNNKEQRVGQEFDRNHKIPSLSVASPMITGYSDLGDFLVNYSHLFIDKKDENLLQETREKISIINQKRPLTGNDKLTRIKLMSQIYDLLPNYIHNEIEKAFAASKLIGNWDFANFSLSNIGCIFVLDENKKVVKFKAVFVDFGNSVALGYGGRYKELSYERANKEAKSKTSSPEDYDPELELNEWEIELIDQEIKLIQQEEANLELELNEWEIELIDQEIKLIQQEEANPELKLNEWEIELIDQEIKLIQQEEANPELESKEREIELIDQEIKPIQQKKNYQKAISNLQTKLAKKRAIYSKPGDEELKLSDEEARLIKSVIFKISHHIREQEAGVEISSATTGFLTFSDLPRNLPFGILFKNALKEKTSYVIDSEIGDAKPNLRSSINYRDSEIEMAFRLSLITDEAINCVIKKWNLSEQYPNIFPLPQGLKNPEKYRGENLAQIFIDRRNVLINSIPHEVVDQWLFDNRPKALAAQKNVENAVREVTDLQCGINEENSLFHRVASLSSPKNIRDDHSPVCGKKGFSNIPVVALALKNQIENFGKNKSNSLQEKLQTSRKELQTSREKLQKIKNNPIQSADHEMIDVLSDALELREREVKRIEVEIEEKNMEEKLAFIRENYQKWKIQLGCAQPSEELFDFAAIERIYKIQNNELDKEIFNKSEKILTTEENSERNKLIHKKNCFICNEFVKTLEELSLKELYSMPNTSFSPTEEQEFYEEEKTNMTV